MKMKKSERRCLAETGIVHWKTYSFSLIPCTFARVTKINCYFPYVLQHEGRRGLDIRKIIFTGRAVKQWTKLPREVVVTPSLSGFEKHCDNSLRNMV